MSVADLGSALSANRRFDIMWVNRFLYMNYPNVSAGTAFVDVTAQ